MWKERLKGKKRICVDPSTKVVSNRKVYVERSPRSKQVHGTYGRWTLRTSDANNPISRINLFCRARPFIMFGSRAALDFARNTFAGPAESPRPGAKPRSQAYSWGSKMTVFGARSGLNSVWPSALIFPMLAINYAGTSRPSRCMWYYMCLWRRLRGRRPPRFSIYERFLKELITITNVLDEPEFFNGTHLPALTLFHFFSHPTALWNFHTMKRKNLIGGSSYLFCGCK